MTSADVAASLNHTKTSPLRSSLFAISSIQTPDPSTVVVNLRSRPPATSSGHRPTSTARSTRRARSPPSPPSRWALDPSFSRATAGFVDRAGEEPQVLGLQGLSARQRGLHPGHAGARSSHSPHLRCRRHDRGRAAELPAAQGRSEHRNLHDEVLRLHGDRVAPEQRTVRQREGAVGTRVRRRPGRFEQGGVRWTRAAGIPTRADVVAGLLQVPWVLRRLQAHRRPRPCSRPPATPRA